MSESKAANWMTAISTLVGVFALCFALFEYHASREADLISRWQIILIYKTILENNGITFTTLKNSYVTEATQLQSFKLPSTEIQDDALRYNLLELQKYDLIYLVKNTDGVFYRPSMVREDNGEDKGAGAMMKAITELLKSQQDLLESQRDIRLARPVILRLLKRDSGKYTSESLVQSCHDMHIKINDEDLYSLIAEFRSQSLIQEDINGRLWSMPYYIQPGFQAPSPQPSQKEQTSKKK